MDNPVDATTPVPESKPVSKPKPKPKPKAKSKEAEVLSAKLVKEFTAEFRVPISAISDLRFVDDRGMYVVEKFKPGLFKLRRVGD